MSDSLRPRGQSLSGSSVRGIFQTRILGWVAASFSRRASRPRKWALVYSVSCIVGRFFTCWASREAPCLPISRNLFKFIPVESVILSNHPILCLPLLLLPSFPASGSFPMSQHQSSQWIFKADILQDWLVWSSCCPRDSQESFPAPQFKSINSLVLSFFMVQLLHPYTSTRKTIALTKWTFVSIMKLNCWFFWGGCYFCLVHFILFWMNKTLLSLLCFLFPLSVIKAGLWKYPSK